VQKITFVFRKINKNCCHQSCTFWLQYAPNRLSAQRSPDPLAVFRPISKGDGTGDEGDKRIGGEGVRICPRKKKREVGAYDIRCRHISAAARSTRAALSRQRLIPTIIALFRLWKSPSCRDEPALLAVSRPSCCTQRRTLSVVNWRQSSVELSWPHWRRSTCRDTKAEKTG